MTRYEELVAAVLAPRPQGCLEWTGAIDPHGYGALRLPGRGKVSVHRTALEVVLGRPVGAGLMALHHCDNRRCFNPDHLYEGTAFDNARDATERTRWNPPRGTDHWASTLTADAVRTIRARVAKGEFQRRVAKDYGLTKQAVSKIVRRIRWAHV